MSLGFLLHGVARATARGPLFDGPTLGLRPQWIGCGGFSAIASPIPERLPGGQAGDQLLVDADLAVLAGLEHNHILTQLSDHADIAPAPLGPPHADEAAIATYVEARASLFDRALDRVAGAGEYLARLTTAEASHEPALADAAEAVGDQRAGGPGDAAALVQRRADDVARFCNAARVELVSLAREHVVTEASPSATGDTRHHLSVTLLVARERHGELTELTSELAISAAHVGIDLTVTGPWPTYSFVDALGADPT